jgi:hypothetical protein
VRIETAYGLQPILRAVRHDKNRNYERVLTETYAFYGSPEVYAGHFHAEAHLRQTGKHTVADAVSESGLASCAFGVGLGAAACREIGIIGGDNGGLLIVVAGVEYECDGIPYPFVGLLRA